MAWTKIKTSLVLGLLLVLLAGGGAVAVHAFSSRSHDDLVAIGSTNNSASPSANLATQPANPDPNLTDYTLAPGEVLKRIAKPDRAVREKMWPYLHGHEPDSMVVEWTDKPEISRQTYGGGQSLDGMLSGIAGLLSFDYSAPRDLLRVQLPGDWVVRRTASTDQRMAALQSLLQSQGKGIYFEKRHLPREVLIARGSFHFQPVSESKWAKGVNIYADKLGPTGWGGASGDVTAFLKDLGDQIDRRVLNQVEPSREPFQWTYHESGNLRGSSPGPGLERKLDEILANVSRQTGLTFEKATAEEDVWYITRTPPAQ